MDIELLLGGLIILPFLMGCVLLVGNRWLHAPLVHSLTSVAVGCAALSALVLLPHVGQEVPWVLTWLPEAGPMSLSLGATGLYAACVTTWAAFLVLVAVRGEGVNPLSRAILLVALAAANVAFLADHFLGRYVALEIVGLCIALAPLVELSGTEGARLTRIIYLILRIGDAGFLSGILLLWHVGGTLAIGPALDAGKSMETSALFWTVAGFLLAVWVKVGAWPFHLWLYPARKLSLPSRIWLYGLLMPNLGLYLLYRVTPLLTASVLLREGAFWLGAACTGIAMLLAVSRREIKASLLYLNAAQGGLALFVAASGEGYVVWLGLLLMTPLRLLLFLSSDLATGALTALRRRLVAALLGLGGLLLTAWGILAVWWMQATDVPLVALWIVEIAVALMGIWGVRTLVQFLSEAPVPAMTVEPARAHGLVSYVLGAVLLVGGLGFRPLVPYLVAASGAHLPDIPSLLTLVVHALSSPTFSLVSISAAVVYGLSWRWRFLQMVNGEGLYGPENSLMAVARAVHRAIESNLLDRGLVGFARSIMTSARSFSYIESNILERGLLGIVRSIMASARSLSRIVEEGGLEGMLRIAIRSVETVSGILQRWHTGRLRYNLVWVVAFLVLALLFLMRGW